jgi:hypothetical protein
MGKQFEEYMHPAWSKELYYITKTNRKKRYGKNRKLEAIHYYK